MKPRSATFIHSSICRLGVNQSGPHAAHHPISMKHEHLSQLALFAGVDVVELTTHFDVNFPHCVAHTQAQQHCNLIPLSTSLASFHDSMHVPIIIPDSLSTAVDIDLALLYLILLSVLMVSASWSIRISDCGRWRPMVAFLIGMH